MKSRSVDVSDDSRRSSHSDIISHSNSSLSSPMLSHSASGYISPLQHRQKHAHAVPAYAHLHKPPSHDDHQKQHETQDAADDDMSTSDVTTSSISITSSAMMAHPNRSRSNIEEISITNRVLRGQATELTAEGAEKQASAGHAAGGETAHHKAKVTWKTALQKYEKFRITQGHSHASLFAVLNPRGLDAVPVRKFAAALNEYCPSITYFEAFSLGCACDVGQRNEISLKDVIYLQGLSGAVMSVSNLLEAHPVFPSWLATRDDFQDYFAEWEEGKGAPSPSQVEQAASVKPENRTAQHLKVLLWWLKYNKILMQVNNKALMEICKKLIACRYSNGQVVFAENDPGDCLFACVSGGLVITIAGAIIRNVEPGSVFGELALERSVPRSATVTATMDTMLVQLYATDYHKLVSASNGSQHGARASNLLVEFISASVPTLRSLQISTITNMVQRAKSVHYAAGDQIIMQGETCLSMCIVIKGNVRITRKVDLSHVWQDMSVLSRDGTGVRVGPVIRGQQLSVSAADLGCGCIFGDDFLRKKNRYSYTALSLDKANILFVPKNVAIECLDKASIEALEQANYPLYQDDAELLLRREQLIRSKLVDPKERGKHSQLLQQQQQQQQQAVNRLAMAGAANKADSSNNTLTAAVGGSSPRTSLKALGRMTSLKLAGLNAINAAAGTSSRNAASTSSRNSFMSIAVSEAASAEKANGEGLSTIASEGSPVPSTESPTTTMTSARSPHQSMSKVLAATTMKLDGNAGANSARSSVKQPTAGTSALLSGRSPLGSSSLPSLSLASSRVNVDTLEEGDIEHDDE